MTYPQPDSKTPVLNAQNSFRLKTPIISGGDLYESEVGARSFAIGPDSDLASVQLTWFDDNSTTKVSQAVITPDRNLIGRIDARNDQTYPGTAPRHGRIFISLNDIYDVAFLPTGWDQAKDAIEFIQPVLDVIQYFVDAPSIAPQRSDREFRLQYYNTFIPDPVNGVNYVVLPAFGRKSGMFTFKNIGNGIVTTQVKIIGAKMSISAAPGPVGEVQKVLYTNAILTGAQDIFNFKSSTDGLWDVFVIGLGGGAGPFPYSGGPFPTTVTLSDDPQ